MAPLAAAIQSMCDLGAQLQPAGISCMLVFGEGGKPENPEKNTRSREENQRKLNPLMASGPGIKPRLHWWEASALTTTPSLLPLSLPYNTHTRPPSLSNSPLTAHNITAKLTNQSQHTRLTTLTNGKHF